VDSLNGLTGAVTLSAGTNISLATVGNDIAISSSIVPSLVAEISGSSPLAITAITSITSQTVNNVSITTTGQTNLCISGTVTFDTNSNTLHDISLFIIVDTIPQGVIFTSSLGGIGHFITVPVQATKTGLTAGPHVISIEAFADTTSIFTALSNSLQVIAI
jgi:hypothetical protein